MEMGEINKIASRKRINVEVEKLREKVSRETAKIIKLKVAQDTAYWDLKEKLQQVEGNHERLQQNMVEVQMQHETISGQYQDELRLRPDTLNKLSSTREICEVLEDYGERLKETLSRCKADQGALCAAYQESGQLVQDLAQKQLRGDEQRRLLIDTLQDKVRVSAEHHAQLLQLAAAARAQAEAELRELRGGLTAALRDKELLTTSVNDLNHKFDKCCFDLEKKQETIANLQKEMQELLEEFNTRSADANNTLMKQENELKTALEAAASLKVALHNQEEYTKTVCEQNNEYQEKLAVLEEEKATSTATVQDLHDKLQASANINENQKNEIAGLIEEKERLLKELNQQEELLLSHKEDINKLNEQIASIDKEKCAIITNLNETTEVLNEKCLNINELTANIEHLNKKLADVESAHKVYRESLEEQTKDLMKTIAAQDKELDSKAGTITHLMSELKMSTDVRSKLETALQKVKKELEIERDNRKEKERKMNENITKLENELRYKEEETSKQMSIILDIRNEKERLQEKIQCMQNTIDNIQKELTGRPERAPAPALQPELDDNAVMLTPQHKKNKPSSPVIEKSAEIAPRKDPKLEAMLYNLFSDSSMEGDNTLDATEVNRRFAALSRGERLSPLPLRRRGAANKHRRLNDPMSQSQLKNDINKGRSFFKNKRADNKTKNNK